MSSRALYRFSGIVLVLGGLLSLASSTIGSILIPDNSPTPAQISSMAWLATEIALFAGLVLILTGFPGGYLRQSTKAGRLGFAGALLLWLGVLLAATFSMVRLTLWPYLAQNAPKLLPGDNQGPAAGFILWILLPGLLLILGPILLGSASLRAGVFSRGVGILLLASGIINLLSFFVPPSAIGEILDPLGDAAFFLALVWIGYTLVAGQKGRTIEQAMPANAQVEEG